MFTRYHLCPSNPFSYLLSLTLSPRYSFKLDRLCKAVTFVVYFQTVSGIRQTGQSTLTPKLDLTRRTPAEFEILMMSK